MHASHTAPTVAADRSATPAVAAEGERGIALVLVLILSILLYVLVAELVTKARTARFTGENDALLARMHNHMRYTLDQVEQMLLDDLQAGAAGAGGAGPGGAGAGGLPLPGAGGSGMPGAGGSGGEAPVDSSQDAWFKPQGYSDNDLTTYVWVEDENRKFNILTLLSPDDEFARESHERFVRLIDVLREGTEFDLSASDGERLYQSLMDWMKGTGRNQDIPKPLLKSDDVNKPQLTIPLHLDELLMVRGIDEDLMYDKVIDGVLIPGLESVLTIYTALKYDPGDPTKQNARGGSSSTSGSGTGTPGSGTPGSGGARPGSGGAPPPNTPQGTAPPEQPIGEGVRININTAPRAVLRCLFSPAEVPDAVIEAILRFRNEEAPPEEAPPGAGGESGAGGSGSSGSGSTGSSSSSSYSGDLQTGEEKPKKIFKSVEELDKIPEFLSLANPALKEKFYLLTTTKSDVFTVHVASVFKRNEERRVFVIRRARSVVMRLDNGSDGYLHPLTLLEEARGIRVQPVDFPEDDSDRRKMESDLDAYAREERSWNPFFIDFYLPPNRR